VIVAGSMGGEWVGGRARRYRFIWRRVGRSIPVGGKVVEGE
jgi:hypothetical protein